jgi:DNA-binding transcriptional regulator YiaG
MTKQYRSRAIASIHETPEGLHAAGVMDKQTMRKFDDACLTPFPRWRRGRFERCGSAKVPVRRCSLGI